MKLLMNIFTGSVDTQENWESEGHFESEFLVEVVKNSLGDWEQPS